MADYVACSPWGGPQVPGTVKDTCVICKRDVALSPQGMAWLAQDTTRKIVCVPCALKSGEKPVGAVPGAVEAALAEIRRIGRDN